MMHLQVIFHLVGSALCIPSSEFDSFLHNVELSWHESPSSRLMGIVPSGYSSLKNSRDMQVDISNVFGEKHQLFNTFYKYVRNGHTRKGITFNIYDDNHRGAANALFKLLLILDDMKLEKISKWAVENLNKDLYDYVWRLATLHGVNLQPLSPPFITKPNYFVNSETIYKAARLKNNNGRFHPDDATVNQYYKIDDAIFINTNYSGWNSLDKGCEELNYFREDIGLNSYAYGLSLLSPFWMPNGEVKSKNPKMLEFIYYQYHYLYARYSMELKHTGKDQLPSSCFKQYDPDLVYDNGLKFPIRPPFQYSWDEGKSLIFRFDAIMKELLRRKFIILKNGTRVNITENNHVELIVKHIRENIGGIQLSKVAMALFGYNAQRNLTEEYNPAPSVVHHSMTQMRDPEFLDKIISKTLDYVIKYKHSMRPMDLRSYEVSEIEIGSPDIPGITTYFQYYSFDVGKAIHDDTDVIQSPLKLVARQKRLTHLPFEFIFPVQALKDNNNVAVRLFIGPPCSGNDCWLNFHKFFELDVFRTRLAKGRNNVTWTSTSTSRYSNDDYYNLEDGIRSFFLKDEFDMFKFPRALLIPRGSEHGLNFTGLIMITPINDYFRVENAPGNGFFQTSTIKIDEKPLGFPFHKPAVGFSSYASNYKLFNLTLFHKNNTLTQSGYFSKNIC